MRCMRELSESRHLVSKTLKSLNNLDTSAIHAGRLNSWWSSSANARGWFHIFTRRWNSPVGKKNQEVRTYIPTRSPHDQREERTNVTSNRSGRPWSRKQQSTDDTAARDDFWNSQFHTSKLMWSGKRIRHWMYCWTIELTTKKESWWRPRAIRSLDWFYPDLDNKQKTSRWIHVVLVEIDKTSGNIHATVFECPDAWSKYLEQLSKEERHWAIEKPKLVNPRKWELFLSMSMTWSLSSRRPAASNTQSVDHIDQMGFNSLTDYHLVYKPTTVLDLARTKLDAKAALDKAWDKLEKLTTVKLTTFMSMMMMTAH